MNSPKKADLFKRIEKLERENAELRKGANLPANLDWLLRLSETCTSACRMLVDLPFQKDEPTRESDGSPVARTDAGS